MLIKQHKAWMMNGSSGLALWFSKREEWAQEGQRWCEFIKRRFGAVVR